MKTRIFMTMLALFAIATTAQAAITCSKPTELTATEITANSVKLSWTENGEATAWEIQYSTDADNIDEGTTILVTDNPYTLTGLTAQTTYYARVRAVCGEGDYSNWSPTATFTTEVRGEKTQVRAVYDNPTNIVYWGEDFTLRLLDDQDETPLKNAAVTLKLNGVDYTKTTDDEGFVKLNIDVDPGEYTITVTYEGDETHYPLNQAYPVQVRWRVRMIKEYSSPIYSRQGEGLKIRLLDDQTGTPVGSGRTVTFMVNNLKYERETDDEGVALLKINLPPGVYNATASFEGQQLSDAFEVRSRVRVVTYDLAKAYMGPEQFKATLLDDVDETPVVGQTVLFNINGVLYNRVSNDDGVAALNINLYAGEYIITTSYNGVQRANRIIVSEYGTPPQPRYAVNVSVSPAEGGQVSGVGDFAGGERATFTATPNEGYRFVGWMHWGVQVSSDNPYSFTVTDSRDLTAVFQERSASCTVKASFAPLSLFGNIQVSGVGTYPEGSEVTLTASPTEPENLTFLGWVDNASNTIISRENPYRFTALQDVNLTAVFVAGSTPVQIETYTVTTACNPTEGGTVTGGGDYAEGTEATVTATPNEGYVFKGWYNGTALVSPDTPYTFTPTGDVTLTAVFAKLYPLWIGDTQVDEANKDDIPGVTGENAKASFDPATNTLTLENVTGVTGSTMGALITAEGINLTVEGSAVLEDKNIDMGIQVAPGSLTLDGDFTISAGSYGIYVQKDVTMVKGSLFAKGKAACGIYSARETLKVNGGTLEAMGSMCALGTVPDFSGYTDEYEVLVNENDNAEGASPWSGDDVNDPLGGFSSSYKYVKIIPILIPTIVLLDDDSEADSKNQELIQANLGEQVGKVNVMLDGRTIYRDGRWNTLCLPFNLADSDDSDGKNCTGTLFEGAIVKRFDSSSYTPETKTLTLSFEDSESIWTGGPYLVRWDSSENLEDLVNPVFKNVEIIDGEPLPDTSDCIDFLGTFSPVTLAAQDRTVLYLGGDSKLYYPGVDVPVNAFRGYFQLKNGLTAGDLPTNGAKNFVLNFGDSTTEIGASLNDNGQWINDNFYSIDGRKLQGEPKQKGIYIHRGKKMVK